jgi:uncharacterized membrane protein
MDMNLENKLFTFGMWWRIAYGFLRIIFGLALLRVVGLPLVSVITSLMGHELVEDPSDILYAFASHALGQHPVYISYFLAIYFIFWGVLDVVLSYNLLKDKIWAFSSSLILIGGFIMYELFRFSHTHSFILLYIICLDVAIFWLIKREYKKLQLHPLRYTHQ